MASYAPKDRTFSRTQSLHTRISIAAAVQVCGYFKLWSRIFEELNVPMDEIFARHLRIMDTVKSKKNARAATKEGKSRRSKKRREKLKRAQELDKEAQKVGLAYESGIALSEAKKAVNEELANAKRNPPGTPKDKWKCLFFHPNYCQVVGHKTTRSLECAMHNKSKEDRDIAMKNIKNELILEKQKTIHNNRK